MKKRPDPPHSAGQDRNGTSTPSMWKASRTKGSPLSWNCRFL